MTQTFPWSCPYCGRDVTLTLASQSEETHFFHNGNKEGSLALTTLVVVCPNPNCREFALTGVLRHSKRNSQFENQYPFGDPLEIWRLKPKSSAKQIPAYVPSPIIDDYREACLIKDLSPKASATLSRRCLQGIIRDYWKISKARLIDEILELKDKTDPLTWQSIDAVRKIGNIGAHMEKDINVIIDVDPNEADMLLRLIEMLIKDWYIARHEREAHLNALINAAATKKV